MRRLVVVVSLLSLLACVAVSNAQSIKKFDQKDKFRQLEELVPTANDYRNGSGAPGHGYWQQKVDHEIDVTLDDEKQRIIGSEKITYTNNSPDTLKYLWLQLDPNIHRPDSDAVLARSFFDGSKMEFSSMKGMLERKDFDGGVNVSAVKNSTNGQDLPHSIVKTMMRVDLPEPLATGRSFNFQIDWDYNINNARQVRGRSGYEFFPDDGNYIYEIAQWFPRLCAYTDNIGWQHKQFLGSGEFTLEFGDYVVRITAPNDHIVSATGVLLNANDVLTETQRQRLEESKSATEPVFIVTPDEAKANESSKATTTKTWVFSAKQVRDFAFASSRKFIWDAVQHDVSGNKVMAMSFFPKEAEPLWSKYSTHAVVHTLNVYSRYSFPYPYPVAQSINGPIGGMEYPMICFNGPRPEKDGTYSDNTKYGLISVIIHEVGHNYFPMVVNSDERQWTWMDEGLNTFLQYLSEQEWEDKYPSERGEPKDIVDYMKSENQVPIMTNSESLLQFGPNAYSKPATALNILRETILGRELFDYSFREYSRRWQFKRPMPADFFRTIEDASGVDLDWFWRGWFYSTDHVDIAIDGVKQFSIDTQDPDFEKQLKKDLRDKEPMTLSGERNEPLVKRTHEFPALLDFYNDFDPLDVTEQDKKQYADLLESLSDDEKAMLQNDTNFYLINFKNVGGLIMPIILELEFEDGTTETRQLPAEVWVRDNERISHVVMTNKEIKRMTLDPRLQTADIDLTNNHYPPQVSKSRFQLFKDQKSPNAMQKAGLGDTK